MPVYGLAEVRAALEKVTREADAASRVIVVKGAAMAESAAKKNFDGSHAKGQPHVGGDKPNVVTGNLRRSITHDPVVRIGVASYGTRVGPTVIYGRRVELGYQGGGGGRGHQTTRPFPYFGPAVAATAAPLNALAYKTWAEFLRP